MDKIALGLLTGLLVSSMTHAECPYSFDAHPTQLAIYSLLQEGNTTMLKPLATTAAQQVSIDLPDMPQKYMTSSRNGIENLIQRINDHSVAAGDITVPNTGKLALEFKIDHFTTQVKTPDNYYKFGVLIYGSSDQAPGQSDLMIELSLTNSTLKHHPETFINIMGANIATHRWEARSYPLSLPLPAEYRLGLYLDQDKGRLGAIINGKDKGYISQKIPAHIDRIVIAPFILSDLDPTNPLVGSMLAGTVITDASQMKLRYPRATRDICGVSLR